MDWLSSNSPHCLNDIIFKATYGIITIHVLVAHQKQQTPGEQGRTPFDDEDSTTTTSSSSLFLFLLLLAAAAAGSVLLVLLVAPAALSSSI